MAQNKMAEVSKTLLNSFLLNFKSFLNISHMKCGLCVSYNSSFHLLMEGICVS